MLCSCYAHAMRAVVVSDTKIDLLTEREREREREREKEKKRKRERERERERAI